MWRKKNEAFRKQNIVATGKKFGWSVMIWGCVVTNGVASIYTLDTHLNPIFLNQF